MLARVFSCAVIGLEGVIVDVEVDTAQGLPGMDIVGLPDMAVQESKQRVMAAIKNAGFPYPRKRLTVNLAPASVRKEGPSYDLPIALGVLVCMEMIPAKLLEEGLVVGELSDGCRNEPTCTRRGQGVPVQFSIMADWKYQKKSFRYEILICNHIRK